MFRRLHDFFHCGHFMQLFRADAKGQIISKGLLVSSNSPKRRTNEFVFTTTTNSFVPFLGEFEDTKTSFQNYLTFRVLIPLSIVLFSKYLRPKK